MRSPMKSMGPSQNDVEAFRRRFPCDERAFSYLAESPPEVIDRVLTSFAPPRLEESDFSAPITGYVKQCRRQVQEDGGGAKGKHAPSSFGNGWSKGGPPAHHGGSSGGPDAALSSFMNRYPVDERCADY